MRLVLFDGAVSVAGTLGISLGSTSGRGVRVARDTPIFIGEAFVVLQGENLFID